MKTQHTHEFKAKRPNPTVLVCDCGRFQNVVTKDNPAIVGIEKPQPTPGPWEVELEKSDGTYRVIDSAGGSVIAYSSDEPNARLIACAPEMLACLKSCYERIDGEGYGDSVMRRMIEKLIARAEGRI